MIRLWIVCLVSAVIAIADLSSRYFVALGVGVIVGGIFFVISAVNGGGMRPIGLAAPHLMPPGAKPPSDPRAGIGSALAAAGIASSAIANHHYPLPFRIFYGFCIVAGIAIAVFQAWRGARAAHVPPPAGG